MDYKKAKIKAANFCAYQERTQQEVRDKLYSLGLKPNQVEQIITELITENFINEERYAITYAGGKFRMKNWGRLKIQQMLMAKNITDYCIRQALAQIDEDEYRQTIHQLVQKKAERLKIEDLFIKRKRIRTYLISKGFEPELVWEILKDEIPTS